MSLDLPSTEVEVQDGGLGIVSTPSENVHVVMGYSSRGVLWRPFEVSTIDRAKGDYGAGQAVKSAAYSIGKTAASVVFVRLAASPRAAEVKDVETSADQTVTITGTPNEGYDILIVCTVDGEVGGVTPPTFKWSKSGGGSDGDDFTSPALLVGTTLELTGTGLTANFTAPQTFVADDTITGWTIAAAQSIGPVTVTRVDASTSDITFTGTPEDDYDTIRFEVLAGGEVGDVGIAYRYSLDGGGTWTTKRSLGTDTSIDLNDGDEPSGVTINLAGGTLDAGDKAEAKAFGPDWAAAAAVTAVGNLLESTLSWRFIHFVGWKSKADIATIASSVADIAAGNSVKHTHGLYSARPRGTFEKESNWEARLVDEFGDFADVRTGVGAGRERLLCPVTKRLDRRTIMFPTVARIVSKTLQVDPGRRLDGPLGTDVQLYDNNKLRVEHDARISPVLHGARFITLRTYYDRPGIWVTRGNLMSANDSDFNRIAYRAVMDLGTFVFNAVMVEQLENHLLVNPAVGGPPGATPGTLREVDARRIDRELETALSNALVAPGYASAVQARVSRTDPFLSTGTLTADVKVTPLGYVDKFKGKISFVNPQFVAFQVA